MVNYSLLYVGSSERKKVLAPQGIDDLCSRLGFPYIPQKPRHNLPPKKTTAGSANQKELIVLIVSKCVVVTGCHNGSFKSWTKEGSQDKAA